MNLDTEKILSAPLYILLGLSSPSYKIVDVRRLNTEGYITKSKISGWTQTLHSDQTKQIIVQLRKELPNIPTLTPRVRYDDKAIFFTRKHPC